MSTPSDTSPPPPAAATIREKAVLNFSLFFIFFFFYLGAAVLQTPALKGIASAPVLGMPFGLLMSLLIFPVSWLIMVIWFKKAR